MDTLAIYRSRDHTLQAEVCKAISGGPYRVSLYDEEAGHQLVGSVGRASFHAALEYAARCVDREPGTLGGYHYDPLTRSYTR